jgi:hypothetical protein
MTTPQFEKPSVALAVTELDNGTEVMLMEVSGPSTRFTFYLCDAGNFAEVARTLHDNIIKAGRTLKRPSRLIEVKGGSDGLRNGQAQGGQLGGTRRKGT